jgi:hypothetical protein
VIITTLIVLYTVFLTTCQRLEVRVIDYIQEAVVSLSFCLSGVGRICAIYFSATRNKKVVYVWMEDDEESIWIINH